VCSGQAYGYVSVQIVSAANLALTTAAEFYAVTFVQSTLGIIFDCGEFAAVPSLVGEQELVTANARIMAAP
jgi:hypothetical protein